MRLRKSFSSLRKRNLDDVIVMSPGVFSYLGLGDICLTNWEHGLLKAVC